jgi:hypothetical protein
LTDRYSPDYGPDVVAVQSAKQYSYLFRVSADIPGKLAELAARRPVTASVLLEHMVASAVEVIVRGKPPGDDEQYFIAKVRELARAANHPRATTETSYALGAPFLEGIRQLQNELELRRNGLVVEYLVRAAWAVEPHGGNEGDDEITKRRKGASYNLHSRRPAPSSSSATVLTLPLTATRQLWLLPEGRSE